METFRSSFVEQCLSADGKPAQAWYSELVDVATHIAEQHSTNTDRQSRYPHESIAALRDIGALGIAAPQELGGLGFSNTVTILAVETLAAACPSSAAILMLHSQVLRRTLAFGSQKYRSNDVAQLARGERLGISAWNEDKSRDKSSPRTTLRVTGNSYCVRGAKTYCTGLEGAGIIHILLDAPSDTGAPKPTFVRVEAESSGVSIPEIYDMMGLRGSSTGTIVFDDVQTDRNSLIGEAGQAQTVLAANHAQPMNAGLLALGICTSLLRDAGAIVSGKWDNIEPTSSFQVSRFALAEMELMLSCVYALASNTIRSTTARQPVKSSECLKLKVCASLISRRIATRAMNLAGARGFDSRWPIERRFRDTEAAVLMGPRDEAIIERIAESILATHTEGETDSNQTSPTDASTK